MVLSRIPWMPHWYVAGFDLASLDCSWLCVHASFAHHRIVSHTNLSITPLPWAARFLVVPRCLLRRRRLVLCIWRNLLVETMAAVPLVCRFLQRVVVVEAD